MQNARKNHKKAKKCKMSKIPHLNFNFLLIDWSLIGISLKRPLLEANEFAPSLVHGLRSAGTALKPRGTVGMSNSMKKLTVIQ